MKYYLTDVRFCQLLRPVSKIKKESKYFNCRVDDPLYNKLVVSEGKWTAKLHEIYDLLCNERSKIIDINDIETSIRRYRLKEYIKQIELFKFTGFMYNYGKFQLPLLNLKDDIINMNYKIDKRRSIPECLYNVSYNAQFLYRHFFSSLLKGITGVYKREVLANFLSFKWSLWKLDDYLEELESVKLIKITHKNINSKVKLLKLL